MVIYPAIDIRSGKCVRLHQGDFDKETVFGDDPVVVAKKWWQDGAEWLHIVDLDGARSGTPVILREVGMIRDSVPIPIQVGGGIRHIESVQALIDAGVDRIILGTIALKKPQAVCEMVELFGERVAVGLDSRNGYVATEGWFDQSDVPVTELAGKMREAGVQHLIVTDIGRDGTMSGPDATLLSTLVDQHRTGIIASGGIGSLADVEAVRVAGADGVVIGQALYTGKIELADAIAIGKREVVA